MEDNNQNELIMQFDPNTIEHLGIQMYSTLPPVIAELVANSYDADAELITINLYDKDKKEIQIVDDGHGMSFNELNDKFLMIGRNRREDEGTQLSPNGRKIIGKKGIGKLSFFGIAESIEITTIKNNIKNSFQMDWKEIKASGKIKQPYKPKILLKDKNTSEDDGTEVKLLNIRRKTNFDPDGIAYSLSKYFTIFDEKKFKVNIIHNNKNEQTIHVQNKLKYKNIVEEFVWSFPLQNHPIEYEYSNQIIGKIISSRDVVLSSMKGVALFSRGKLVNDHNFYDVNASSMGYSYITGWLNVDFIDDWDKEVISTNRRSLHWEDSDTAKLKDYLNAIIRAFYNKAKEKRAEIKIKEIEDETGVKLIEWIQNLPKHDRKLAQKLVNSIVTSEGIETQKSAALVSDIKDYFQLESFKEIAEEIDESFLENPQKLLEFFKEWKIIEAREMYKLSRIRIETIKKFEKHIKNDSPEVPELHNFLKQFPWLLDPRIMNFRDEVTFSRLLKEKFEELNENEEDKRIDFLCVDFSENFFIIELKRPRKVIGEKELLQANKYVSFIKERFGNEYSKNICCYIIGKKLSSIDSVKNIADAFKTNKTVYVKPYDELLATARNYHQEFIDKYDNLNLE
jgi:Histidine kinase-, DNA gyrase B-, and HSP90-like ATPase